jgi:glycosyltransferase involved in cell wall biosynthesis
MESLQAQSLSEWELIVVDDGSTDDSPAILANWAARDPRIRVVLNRVNRGVGHTKATCASMATAPIVAILDPDDALEPEALSVVATAHSQLPDASLIWTEHFVCDDLLAIRSTSASSFAGDAKAGYLSAQPGSIHAFWSVKRSAYMKTAGFSKDYWLAEDQDLFYKLEEVGATRNVPIPLYRYRMHQGGISTGQKTAEAFGWHLLAMADAVERRTGHSEAALLAEMRRVVQSHWENFSTWGITTISSALLLRIIRRGIRARMGSGVLWPYLREKIRRTVRG